MGYNPRFADDREAARASGRISADRHIARAGINRLRRLTSGEHLTPEIIADLRAEIERLEQTERVV